MSEMNYKYEDGRVVYSCGCSFQITGGPYLPRSDFPMIKFNPDTFYPDHDINFSCQHTWDLLMRGDTIGVFQLESNLAKKWTKKLKPDSINELAALSATIRPGASQNIDDKGLSTTDHYCMRKNGEEEFSLFHPSLGPALKDTWGVLIYQESAMRIAVDIAGFTDQEADGLRKAIGKKLPEEMAKIKTLFLEGCKKTGIVTDAEAAEIFDWIEKSQRYSFNRSHAVGYALLGYICAYTKCHFPLHFYTSCLTYVSGQDRDLKIRRLSDAAKLMDINFNPPDITLLENKFHTDGQNIFFGISDIKKVGEGVLDKIKDSLQEKSIDINTVSWFDFLIDILDDLSITVVNRMIEVGAFRRFEGMTRKRMEAEYDIWHNGLRDGTEKAWIIERRAEFPDLLSAMKAMAKPRKEGGGCANVKRVAAVGELIKLLENPPSPFEDAPDWIGWCEKEYLGIPLTYSELDKYDITQASHTCKDIVKGYKGYAVLAITIREVKTTKTKKGKNPGKQMGFVVGGDETCTLDNIVVFSEAWKNYSHLLMEDSSVFISGKLTREGSFSIEKVYPMEDDD